jgi:hypothetical protein
MNGILERAVFPELAERLNALYSEEEDALLLAMLGQEYAIRRSGITLRGQRAPEPHETVLLDYLGSRGSLLVQMPWRALGDFANGQAADFRKKVELPLAQHIVDLAARAATVLPLIDGQPAASMIGSDLAFTVRALPKVHLHVELSQENQEFPAEAWVLYSNNADAFLSTDGLRLLADLFRDRLLSLLRIY